MEIHIQQCQSCKSDKLKNILYRSAGESDKVYVQCQDCEEFVASYVIEPAGYYHHGKGYESFLRGINRSGEFMSGNRIKNLFLEHKNGEIEAFDKVMKLIKERGTK
jgi:hemerythrin-like domain-containing protein